MDDTTLAIRAGAALLAGLVIGIDRELHRKPAGMRTHAMVSLGAALVVLSVVASGGGDDAMSRAVQGIITGIGFIGGGVILQLEEERRVQGLTTAASIWVAAGIGIACGAGHFTLAAIGVLATIFLLTAGNWVESRVKRWYGPAPGSGDSEHKDRGGK